jgi:hypothetical protein
VAKDVYLKADGWNVPSHTVQELLRLRSKQQQRDDGREEGNITQRELADARAVERIEVYEKHRRRNASKKGALLDCLHLSNLSESKIRHAHRRFGLTPR